MKLPVIIPSCLCGECGIQMLPDRRPPQERLAGKNGPTLIMVCYTPQCPQQGEHYEVLLQPAVVLDPPVSAVST